MKKWTLLGKLAMFEPHTIILFLLNFVFLLFRKNHGRQLDALQESVEEETKAKNEATRQKKLAEGQLDDLQTQLDAATKVSKQHCYLICGFN